MHTAPVNRILGGGECLSGGRGLDGQTPPPPVDRMTHACENITFPHTTYAVRNN